jgi:predicted TIM-barrel fold metal-dependent hydrolase
MISSYHNLIEYIHTLPVIDSHEHLPGESERIDRKVDFTLLFSHYCRDDLAAAGMTEQQQEQIFGDAPVPEKWQLLEPFLSNTETSGYMRAAYLAMQKFYGMGAVRSLDDAVELTARVKAANKAGLYSHVLQEGCAIRRSMNFVDEPVDRQFFNSVKYIGNYTMISHMNEIMTFERLWNKNLPTLQRYVAGMLESLQADVNAGIKGVKIAQAYFRPLDFDATTAHDAELVYNRLFNESKSWNIHALGNSETKPLENYLTRLVVEFAGDHHLPVIIHVGFQTARYMKLDDARPHRLWEMLRRYRSIKFSMLHGGLPWINEAAVMARQLPNLSMDMGWMHIMSPEMAVQALKYFFDMVPMNKVLGFGGDYEVVEKVYGHLEIARQNIALALSDRVDYGAITLEQAKRWCRALLHDSANEFYTLGFEPLENSN